MRVREDGALKLMDFGLMGQLGQPSTRTVTGSPGYLAPEVAVGGGDRRQLRPLRRGLPGLRDGHGRAALQRQPDRGGAPPRRHQPRPPRELRPDLPERLERLILRMLEKEQGRRYRSAAAVLEDLAALAGVAATRSARTSAPAT